MNEPCGTQPELAPEDRTASSWLAARTAADHRARAAAGPLLDALAERLAPGPAHGIDLGSGTGANHRYLSERLGVPVQWTVLDHDSDHLAHTAHADATKVLAGVAELEEVLHRGPANGQFLTCSAVLDVLRERDVAVLAELITRHKLPALFSLSVTGVVELAPADPLDARITEAFNAHQRRDDRLGPGAPAYLAERLPAGWLRQVETPWLLRARDDAALLRRYLAERTEAAIEQDRGLSDAAAQWLQRRTAHLESGQLEVLVGHVDQLVLPD